MAKRILIITASIGAGHNQAAKAIAFELARQRPDLHIQVLDAMEHSAGWFKWYYLGLFLFGMTKAPWFWGFGCWLSDRPQKPGWGVFERFRHRTEWRATARLRQAILDFKPDLIVNSHFLAAAMLDRMIDQGDVKCPQVVVVTDNVVHRFWYAQRVATYYVPAADNVETLRRWGVEAIVHSGMPVHPKWIAPVDRAAVFREWKLPEGKPIVVLSGGTEFVCGPIVRIANAILADSPQAHVVVMAGRNKQLLEELAKQPLAGKRLTPLGFTDRAHELLEVATLMVTKPGGITTAECVAKGVPMVLLRPVPGQEGGNAKHFARHGAAVVTKNPAQVVAAVRTLLADPAKLAAMREACRGLYLPGTQNIVKDLQRFV